MIWHTPSHGSHVLSLSLADVYRPTFLGAFRLSITGVDDLDSGYAKK